MILKALLNEIGFQQDTSSIFNDKLSSQQIIKGKASERYKHIDIKLHFIRDLSVKKEIEANYILTDYLSADFWTKAVNKLKHYNFLKFINLGNCVEI